MSTTNFGLSAPHEREKAMLEALFNGDENITLSDYNPQTRTITLTTKTATQARIVKKYLRTQFLNIKVTSLEEPMTFASKEEALAEVFGRNPYFSRLVHNGEGMFTYDNILFKNLLLRVYEDDVFCYDASASWSPEDLVKHFFGAGKIESEPPTATNKKKPVEI